MWISGALIVFLSFSQLQPPCKLYFLFEQPTPSPPYQHHHFLVLRVWGFTVYDAICATFLSWRGARGHGTADLLTEKNDDHDLRGKRMPMLQLMIIVGTEHRQSIQTASIHPVKNTECQLLLQSAVYYSAAALSSLTYRFKRLLHIAPLSPLSYESNQLELNTDSTGITACHIRHPSVKITTSLPLCRGPCHAMITCHKAWDVCSGRGKKETSIDFTTRKCEIRLQKSVLEETVYMKKEKP